MAPKPVMYYKGDELLGMPSGDAILTLGAFSTIALPDTLKEHPDVTRKYVEQLHLLPLRSALWMSPHAQLNAEAKDALKTRYKTRESYEEFLHNMRESIATLTFYQHQTTPYHNYWNIISDTRNDALKQALAPLRKMTRISYYDYCQLIDKTLARSNPAAPSPDDKDFVYKNFLHQAMRHIPPAYAPGIISEHEFTQAKEILESRPDIMPAAYQAVFANRNWPILLSNAFPKAKNHSAHISHSQNGTYLDSEHVLKMVADTGSRLDDISTQQGAARMTGAALTMAVMMAERIDPKELGVTDENWPRYEAEFKNARHHFMWNDSILLDDNFGPPEDSRYNIADVIGYMNTWAVHNTDRLSEVMPECAKLRERFHALLAERAQKLDPDYLAHYASSSPAFPVAEETPSSPPEPKGEPPAQPAASPGPDLQSGSASLRLAKPRTFEELWPIAEAFTKDNLEHARPYFRCQLNITQPGFPLTLSMGDGVHKAENFNLVTGITNLEEAIAMKQRIQTRILRMEGVHPRYRENLGMGALFILRADDFFPVHTVEKPSEPTLPANTKHYIAEFKSLVGLPGGEVAEAIVQIPLGVSVHNPFAKAKATERLERLNRHIDQLRDENRFVSVQDISSWLRATVKAEGHEWEVAHSLPLEGYNKSQTLDFPAARHGQTTTLRTARIVYRDDLVNPSWCLDSSIRISGNGFDDSEEALRPRGICPNLHTTDEYVAAAKARAALEHLQLTVAQFAEDAHKGSRPHADVRWQAEDVKDTDRKRITLKDEHGNSLSRLLGQEERSIRPEDTIDGLAALINDMPQPKDQFVVRATRTSCSSGERPMMTLTVHNGIDEETLSGAYLFAKGKPISCNIGYAPGKEEIAERFAHRVEEKFRKEIITSFSGRSSFEEDGESIELLQGREHYHPRKIKNQFTLALRETLEEPEFKDEITVSHVPDTRPSSRIKRHRG